MCWKVTVLILAIAETVNALWASRLSLRYIAQVAWKRAFKAGGSNGNGGSLQRARSLRRRCSMRVAIATSA